MKDTELFTQLLGIHQPWYITRVEFTKEENRVDIFIDHAENLEFPCPECGIYCSVYDHTKERELRHLNVFQMETYIHVRFPRVECKQHGVRQIVSDLVEGSSTMTFAFESHVLDLAQECSIEGITRLVGGCSWHACWRAFERAVERGRSRKARKIPERLSVDEKSFAKGHKYETIVVDSVRSSVEFVCDDREQESLEAYYKQFESDDLGKVKSITMDMWDPYIAATKVYIPEAAKKIVFDRFHVMKHVNNAVDKVRKEEHKDLQAAHDDSLKGTKHLWLWAHERIPAFRLEEFTRLRSQDLKTGHAWAIKENIRQLWNYVYEKCMRQYFAKWYWWATHSRLEPMIGAAKTLKVHLDNIVTYAHHHVTNAICESLNSKIEKVKRMACGYRNREHYRIAIYFHCGGLDLYPRTSANGVQILTA